MQESDFVKTHRTRHHREETLLHAIFFKFSIKNEKIPFGNCKGKGGRGRRGSEKRRPAAVIWVRVDGSGLVVAQGP